MEITTAMNKILYDNSNRLAEMIQAHPNLLLMITHFNIPLGFGDKTVAEVCHDNGIDLNFFLLICNVYAFDNYVPTAGDLQTADMGALVPYLESSHRYYLERRLPHIEHHIDRIAQLLPSKRVQEVFMKFFKAYCDEIKTHFLEEEQHVFPLIQLHLQGQNRTGWHESKQYAMSHVTLLEQLDDLTQIIFKYLPDNVSREDSVDVVFDILQLSQDLKKHNVIEEKILIPYVDMITKRLK